MGFWLTLLIYAALFVLSDLLTPKPKLENAKPAGIGDFQFPTATEGRALPLGWGTFRVAGPNVVWYGDLYQEKVKEKVKTGLFSSESVTRGYKYHLGVQSALLQGEADALRGVWIGDDVVMSPDGIRNPVISNAGSGYSDGDELTLVGGTFTEAAKVRVKKIVPVLGNIKKVELVSRGKYTTFPSSPASLSGGSGSAAQITFESGEVTHGGTFTINEPTLFGDDDLGNGGVVGTFEFFAGTGTQAVSSYLSAFQKEPPDTGDTPAYRDCCYIAPETEHTYLGNSTSIKPWKYELRRCPNFLSLTANRHIVNDGDANPANVLYEVMTNTEWGFGIPAADINTALWVTVANDLYAEGNGFSMLLDRQEDIGELVRRLEEQIDSVTYLNPFTGKWEIKLIRDDYDPLLVPELDNDNIVSVRNPTRGSWEGTKNQVRVPFFQRSDDYKSTYGFAQDMANMLIVDKTTTASVTHPGVADEDLANALAWRELRTLAIPLLTVEIVVTRALYGVLPGDVVTWTNEELGFQQLPMRVRAVNYGELLAGEITLSLVQDVFRAAVGSFASSGSSGWEPPSDTLVAFPTDEQLAFEAPRALTLRDPSSPDPTTDKVYAAARRQGPEASFLMVERHASGTPSGGYAEFGQVFGFCKIGELLSALPVGSTYPLTSLTVVATPDSQSGIETEFPDVTDLVELGTDLLSLCMVGTEFFLVTSAQNSGANVQLNGVYRGVLDSPQQAHSAGDPVFLLFVSGGISTGTIPAGDNVDVKLLPRSITATLPTASATAISFTMADRVRRPYPPSEMSINGTRFDPTVSLEGGAGTGESIGIDLTFKRRDFRVIDEVAALLTDAATLDPTYPSANSTTHEVEVFDTSGTPTSLFTQNLGSGTTGSITRLDILQATGGVLPTDLRFDIRSTHTFGGTSYDSRYDLEWEFALSSALTGQFEYGALDTSDVSNAFTVDADTNNHDFTLSSSFTAGNVEYRINGGTWTTLITAGGTNGSIPAASLTNGDTIEIRHLSSDVGAQKLITMTDGAAAAFGVLFT